MRIIHRYLGFFLAGIMAVYAVSGIVLIFRDSDTFKREVVIEKTLETDLSAAQLGKELNIKRFEAQKTDGDVVYFKNGTYNQATGAVYMTKKELPYVMDKMTGFHKAKSGQPLFFLNIFFGLGLLFFVISSFWMFLPKSPIFKKCIYFTAAGMIVTLVLLFV